MSKRPIAFWDRLPRLLYPDIARRDGEVELLTIAANRSQRSRAVGGRLTLTNQRLAFTPHRLEFGAEAWSRELAQVEHARIEPEGKGAFDGSRRSRLAVETPSGVDFFVVRDPAVVAEEISKAR